MQQKWRLWLICLIACTFNGRIVVGQTLGFYHEIRGFYHETHLKRNHEGHLPLPELHIRAGEELVGKSVIHEERKEHEGKSVNHEEHEVHEGKIVNHEEREVHEGKSRADCGTRPPVHELNIRADRDITGPFHFLVPADSLHRGRFWVATGVTTALYAGSVIVLNEAWYTQFPRSSFHFFDDTGEWRYMDKAGHLYTSYFESLWSYKIARWTGMSDKSAIWTGAALGLFSQATIEVLDGFSKEWGFSLADMGFNMLGSGVFLTQQRLWGEQRVSLKVSSTPMTYPDAPIPSTVGAGVSSLRIRTDDLFGTGFAERFLKDYNAQTIWLSVNVHAFLNPQSRFPKWLNIAVGYGAENMYGGFGNSWIENGAGFELEQNDYPRYGQFYLSPDIDFSRIPSRSPLVRTLLGMLNVFKMPGPVLEMSREEGVQVKVRW